MALTRERILSASLSLLGAYGLGDLSMRRVAAELDVAPGALYYHVRNKQELLVLLAAEILRGTVPASTEPAPADPRETAEELVAVAGRVREALLEYPDASDVVSLALALHPEAVPPAAALAGLLRGAGLPAREAEWGAQTLLHAVLGFVGGAQTRARAASPTEQPPGSPDAGFAFGVDAVVRGLLAGIPRA